MSAILILKNRVEAIKHEYELGELTKEEYLELLKDVNTANLIAETSEEVKQLSDLNKLINNLITGFSLVV